MDEKDFEVAIVSVKKMIADNEKQKEKAIKAEQWDRANNLDHYGSGLLQVLVVFELVK